MSVTDAAAKFIAAVQAIDDAIAADLKDKPSGTTAGEVKCPRCESGQLRYVASRRGTKRHTVRAMCTTDGCVRLMS